MQHTQSQNNKALFIAFIPCEIEEANILRMIAKTSGVDPSSLRPMESIYNLPSNYKIVSCTEPSVYNQLLNKPIYLKGSRLLAWPYEGKKTVQRFFDSYLSKTAFVTGVPKRISLDQIREHINAYGQMIELYVVQNKVGNNRHYGFAIFKSVEELNKATEKKNFKMINEINGKKVKICCKKFQAKQIEKFKYSLMGVKDHIQPRLEAQSGGSGLLDIARKPAYYSSATANYLQAQQSQTDQKILVANQSSNPALRYKTHGKLQDSFQPLIGTKIGQGHPQTLNTFNLSQVQVLGDSFGQEGGRAKASSNQYLNSDSSYHKRSSPNVEGFTVEEFDELNRPFKSGLGSRQEARIDPILSRIAANHLPHKNNVVFRSAKTITKRRRRASHLIIQSRQKYC